MKHIYHFSIFCFCLFACILSLTAQDVEDGGGSTNGAANSTAVSSFNFPVSPEAGSLGLYGKVPVNLSTGKIGFQVPLHNFDLGKYSWPIGLSYSYSGFILEEKASVSGLGWVLTGQGAVVREVRGIPDEHPNGYYKPHVQSKLNQYFANGSITYGDADLFATGDYDGEPDKYSVSVNGVDFSFKIGINNNRQPEYLSIHNFQVAVQWGNGDAIESFEVTDDRGIVYFFDKKETNSPVGGNSNVFNDSFTSYVSAWRLSQVTFPNNRTLTFNYTQDTYTSVDFVASGAINAMIVYCGPRATDDYSYNEGYSKTNISRQLLKSITSDRTRVELGLTGFGNTSLYSTAKVTSTIQLDNQTLTRVPKYFIFSHEGARSLLSKVSLNNKRYYDFDYRGVVSSMPGFFNSETDRPYSQDIWGFYNGENNNSSLTMPNTPYQSNKQSSFSHTSLGALSKITYPTGGYTLISYEQNSINGDSDEGDIDNVNTQPLNWRLKLNLDSDYSLNRSGPSYKEEKYSLTFDEPTYAKISHDFYGDYRSSAGIRISKVGGSSGCGSSQQYHVLAPQMRSGGETIPQLCPYLDRDIDDQSPPPGGASAGIRFKGDSEGVILIETGTYEFKMFTNRNNTKSVKGRMTVNFHRQGRGGSNTGAEQQGVPVGGIRVKKTVDVADTNALPIVNNYRYVTQDGLPSGILLQKGFNRFTNIVEHCCTSSSGTGGVNSNNGVLNVVQFYRANFNYKTFNPLNLNQGQPVFYKSVISYNSIISEEDLSVSECDPADSNCPSPLIDESGDPVESPLQCLSDCYGSQGSIHLKDNYNNGYTLTTYKKPKYYKQDDYPIALPEGLDRSMGRVEEQQIFMSENGSSNLQQKSTTSYLEVRPLINSNGHVLSSTYPNSLKVFNKIVREGECSVYPPSSQQVTNDYFGYRTYKEYDTSFLPVSSENSYTSNSGRVIINTSSITYDHYRQIKTNTTVNSDGQELKQENFYPYDLGVQSAYNNLSEVVGIKSYKNTELSFQKTEYSSALNSGPDIVLPSRVLSSKNGAVLKENVHYTKYDQKGNLIEQRVQRGNSSMVSAALYGYGYNYPIAKIVNATYDQVIAALDVPLSSLQSMDDQDLSDALRDLRENLPSAQVTSFTFKPLIGMTSFTDPKGNTVYYEYDELNRLERVKDRNNNILNESKYNFGTND